MPPLKVSPELKSAVAAVTNKRARFVLDFILANGFITADDIQRKGYIEHRRAVMDCRDLGFPIIRTKSPAGVGAWTLDVNAGVRAGRTGRKNFKKSFRQQLIVRAGGRCEACGASEADRQLQIDHRIPYEIDPGSGKEVEAEYQMLCGSCNRSKSWTCEHECPNWKRRDPSVCQTCMWADPEDYEHIATRLRRRITIVLDGRAGADLFDRLKKAASDAGLPLDEFLRNLLERES
ncbi:MAG TPA: HNH endonuclease signature motif containing protein [Solirubrobacterales bacterium]